MKSNLPPDFRGPRQSLPIEMTCHFCRNVWQALITYEHHSFEFLHEHETFCPKCGHEEINSDQCTTCVEARD
jgi:hypothetical protein